RRLITVMTFATGAYGAIRLSPAIRLPRVSAGVTMLLCPCASRQRHTGNWQITLAHALMGIASKAKEAPNATPLGTDRLRMGCPTEGLGRSRSNPRGSA